MHRNSLSWTQIIQIFLHLSYALFVHEVCTEIGPDRVEDFASMCVECGASGRIPKIDDHFDDKLNNALHGPTTATVNG